jgi:TIR domain
MIVAVTAIGNDHLRAQVLANLAAFVASDGHRVVVMSADKSHYFLTSVLGHLYYQTAFNQRPGIYDLILDYYGTLTGHSIVDQALLPRGRRSVRLGTIKLRRPCSLLFSHPASKSLLSTGDLAILRGGRSVVDPSFEVNWPDFARKWAGHAYFEFLRQELLKHFDFVIVECPGEPKSAVQDIIMRSFADAVILLPDFTSGSFEIAEEIAAWTSATPTAGKVFERVPMLIPVFRADLRAEFEASEKWLQRCSESFGHYVQPLLNMISLNSSREFFERCRIPVIAYYEMNEVIIAFRPSDEIPPELLVPYRTLATAIESIARSSPRPSSLPATLAAAFASAGLRGEWDVFISYASDDIELARLLRGELIKRGVRTFVAEEDMAGQIGTDRWVRTLERVIRRSNLMVVLFSKAACASRWVELEWRQFLAQSAPEGTQLLIPVCLGSTTPEELAEEVAEFHSVSWPEPTAAANDGFKATLERVLAALGI